MSHHFDTRWPDAAASCSSTTCTSSLAGTAARSTLDVNSNITGVYAQPGFHPEARYEFKVHFDGAAFEELTYRTSFGQPDAAGRQPLQLRALADAEAREDSAGGELVLEGTTGETPAGDA